MAKKKVLLLGWDAADWQIIWPLIKEGKMPALKKLIQNGVYANMSTMDPPFSPMLWTSVATGKTPDKHGILNFIEVNENNDIQPAAVTSRKTRAVWNIFTNQKIKSNIVSWWPTHPVEPILGSMVSDKFQKGYNKEKDLSTWELDKKCVHPPELYDIIKESRMHPREVTGAHILPFIPEAHLIPEGHGDALKNFSHVLAQNVSVHAAATYLMEHTEWDFMAVYYDAIDHFCHAFMKYHPPKLNGVPQELFDRFKEVISGAYRFQDMMLERMIKLAPKDTTIIVMSDHGYESGNLRILKMPKFSAAPAMEHRQFGMFAASGPEIKKGEKIFGLNLFDIAPTLLHHYDLPIGKDMDGKPILDMYKNPKKVNFIESWDLLKGDFGEHTGEVTSTIENQEQLQQLIELGYVEPLSEDKDKALRQVKCDVKHNLARVYKGKKDYDSAKELLGELIAEDIDTIPFYMDLLNIALKEEEYPLADSYLKKLRTLEKTFDFTTTVAEAKIELGMGRIQKGIQLLEEAKAKKPKASVWFELGKQYLRLEDYNQAKEAFESALELEIDNARFHQGLATTLNRLGDYETAADHALTSIELVKYFPEAHYTLGEALEKLGELEMAKAAFETAERLKPREHHRAKHAIENITKQLVASNPDATTHEYLPFDKDQILIVSGLPRSGTSLMMQMLHSTGINALVDGLREADISNPKGYFEYEPVKALQKDNSWIHLAKGKSLKVVAPLLRFLDTKYRYKVIFMIRDLNEVVKSQQIMIGKKDDVLPITLLNSYKKQLKSAQVWNEREPGVEMLYVDYKDVVTTPDAVLGNIVSFVNGGLDEQKMKECIDPKLYRNNSAMSSQKS